MSDAEKQLLLDAIHTQLNNAISYNLYTGLAYGTFESVLFPHLTEHSFGM